MLIHHSPENSSYAPECLNEYNGRTLMATSATLITRETVLVALRYYARRQTASNIGWDDLIIAIAWLSNFGLCVLGLSTMHFILYISANSADSRTAMINIAGVGRHLTAVLQEDPAKMISWAESIYTLAWLYLTSVALPKVSILCLYLRMFTHRGARIACYITIIVVAAD